MNKELVVVATSDNVAEAEFLKSHLEEAGYEVYIADNHIIGAYNFLAPAVGWIKLKVPAPQAETAANFVRDIRNAEIIREQPEPESWKED